MKQLYRVMGIALVYFLGFSPSASGQKTYALGVGGGASIPVGKLSDAQSTGYNGIVSLAIGVAELPLGVRFDAIYNNFRARTAPVGGAASSDLRIMGALGNLVFAFPGTSAKPYAFVGAGLCNTKSDIAGAKSENNFGFGTGLGVTFSVGPFATFFEARYQSVSRKAASGGVMQFVPITVGLMF